MTKLKPDLIELVQFDPNADVLIHNGDGSVTVLQVKSGIVHEIHTQGLQLGRPHLSRPTVYEFYSGHGQAFPAQNEMVHNKPVEAPKEEANPQWGFAVNLLMPTDKADEVLANIERHYPHWVAKYGSAKANWLFGTQCAGSIFSFWVAWLLKCSRLIDKFRMGGQ